MNVLKPERKLAILTGFVEDCSLRSISGMTGCHLETILKVLMETGDNCKCLLDEKVRGLHCEAVECDELWVIRAKEAGSAFSGKTDCIIESLTVQHDYKLTR